MSCREDITLEPLAWYEYNSNTGDRYETHPVKLKEPNAWGLYDMHGNVWEWCWDLYGEDYYRMSPSVDPTGPPFGPTRVKRGGSWNSYAEYCRSATRSSHVPYNRSFNLGFRPIRQVDE
jgi:formylglycine-generating enzyme required for sulfatase activity